MEFSRLHIVIRDIKFYLFVILAAIGLGLVGVQWGFLISFGILIAVTSIIVIISNIKVGLILLLCSYFFVRPIYYFPVSLLTYIRLDDVLWALVVVSWLVNIKRNALHPLPLSGAIAILCGLIALSGIRVFILTPTLITIENFFWFLMRLLQYMSVYFIVGTVNFTDKERSFLFTLMILSGIVVAAIVFMQFLGLWGMFPSIPYINDSGAVIGTFTFKAQMGAVAMILALLVIDKMVRQKWNLWLGFLLLGCFCVLLLISQSRSSWIGFLVGVIVYLFLMESAQAKMIWAMILLVVGVLLFSIQGTQQLYTSHPIFDLSSGALSQDGAISARLTSLPLIFQYLMAHPDVILLGVGFMNWRYTLLDATTIFFGHNNYISALVELGALGLIAFCYFLLRGLITARKYARHNLPYSQYYLSLLAGLCVACLFEDIFWPAVAQESFLAFFMFISALSLPYVLNWSRQDDTLQPNARR